MIFGTPQNIDDLSKARNSQASSGMGVDTFRNMKELQFGAGTSKILGNRDGFGIGGVNVLSAPFQVSYAGGLTCTGANITGAINATSGTISGNLTVTGSLFSDDGTGFQMELISGGLLFLKSSVQKGYVKTAAGGNGLTIGSDNIFFTTNAGVNLMSIDSSGNLNFSDSAAIKFPSGRNVSDGGSSVNVNGDLQITGGYYVGSSGGVSGSFYAASSSGGSPTHKVTVTGGIITNIA